MKATFLESTISVVAKTIGFRYTVGHELGANVGTDVGANVGAAWIANLSTIQCNGGRIP